MSEAIPSRLRLRVITPGQVLVDSEVQEVSLPSLEGILGILPGHRPLLSALGSGEIRFLVSGKERRHAVQGGYAEIFPDRVLVFTEIYRSDSHGTDQGKG